VLEDRMRQLADQLVGDSSLTDALDDREGQRLLDWAIKASQRLANQTAQMDDLQAESYLGEKAENLRRMVRRIGRLAGEKGGLDPQAIGEHLGQIFEAAESLPGLRTLRPADLMQIAQSIQTQTPEDTLNLIMELIGLEAEDAESATPAAPAQDGAVTKPLPPTRGRAAAGSRPGAPPAQRPGAPPARPGAPPGRPGDPPASSSDDSEADQDEEEQPFEPPKSWY